MSPRRLPEKACTVSPRLPSPVEYRWAAVGTAAGCSRAGGPFLIFYSVRSPSSSSAFGIGRRPVDRDLFLSGSPFSGEGRGRRRQRCAGELAAAAAPSPAPRPCPWRCWLPLLAVRTRWRPERIRRWKLRVKNEHVERVPFSERYFGQRINLTLTDRRS